MNYEQMWVDLRDELITNCQINMRSEFNDALLHALVYMIDLERRANGQPDLVVEVGHDIELSDALAAVRTLTTEDESGGDNG